eukprot:15364857-Ditylum_brightwellii.AAC.1
MVPDEAPLSSNNVQFVEKGRGQAQQLLCFQASCDELKGWFTYGTELKSLIDTLEKIMLTAPITPDKTVAQLDKDTYKEEVREKNIGEGH